MKYDLEERVAKFGEDIIDFAKSVTKNEITKPLVNQIIRSGTSIGANYMEANEASSKKDFRNKIKICCKESRETKHWLRMIARADEKVILSCKLLWKEADEINKIFGSIARKSIEVS
jgi:four helix bundle protein